MDVQGVGLGPAGAELSGALRGLPGLKEHKPASLAGLPQSGDATSAILRELSQPDVVRFLEIHERPASAEVSARIEQLIHASASAAAEGNLQQALAKLIEVAALHPHRVEALGTEPSLASIRAEVGRLVFQLSSTAQLNAEFRFRQAAHLVHAAGSGELLRQGIRPEIAVLIAERLLEAGGYANSVRSAEISQMLINEYGWAPAQEPLSMADRRRISLRPAPSSRLRKQWMPWIKNLWGRAPLLVLLLGWFFAGLFAGSVLVLLQKYWPQTWPESLVAGTFDAWAIGFLALIGFGFYMRVRNIRW